MLHTIDAKWKDHLYAVDQLKEGIGLRAFGHRDPLIEYKREGFEMFEMMYWSINQDIAEMVFRIKPVRNPEATRGVFSSLPQKLVHNEYSSLSASSAPAGDQGAPPQPEKRSSPQPVHNQGPKVGRNDPCPCGSGQKYKKCCGK